MEPTTDVILSIADVSVDAISPDQIIFMVKLIVELCAEGGWGFVIALGIAANLIMDCMKLPIINKWLNTSKIKEHKWWIVLTISCIGGFAQSYGTDQNLMLGLSQGLSAGILAIGIRETTRRIPWINSLMEVIKTFMGAGEKVK